MKTKLLSGLLATTIAASMLAPVASYAKPPVEPPHAAPGPMHKPNPAMHMANRLASMETAIGIRSDQLDAWRKYTSSLMDMMPKPPTPPSDKAAAEQLLFGEEMANDILQRSEKATAFKQAAAELRKVLDEKQLQRMAELSKPPHGPEHPGPHHPPMKRPK